MTFFGAVYFLELYPNIYSWILGSPNIRELLVAGGMKVDDQIRALEAGVDIVVATPGKELYKSGY